MANPDTHINCDYEFGPFRLLRRECQLLRNQEVVHLTPKAFEMLLYLIDRRGQLVERDTLMDAVWGESIVTDNSLTQCIRQIRVAIGNGEDSPVSIETVPTRGFRLNGKVDLLQHSNNGVDESADYASLNRRPALALTGFVVAILLFIAAYLVFDRENVSSEKVQRDAPRLQSIAVLPFDDMSPTGDQAYFSKGIADQLRDELQGLEGLRVAGRTSSVAYARADHGLQMIGKLLNVDSTLVGSIRKDGDIVLITTQLINSADGLQIWSETYRRNMEHIFLIQEEIASSVAGALGVRLAVGDINSFRGAGTSNVAAYEAFLRGMEESGPASMRSFERAIQLDKNYSVAWAMMARRTVSGIWQAAPKEAAMILGRAREYALHAVELNPESALANSKLALITAVGMDWVAAEPAHNQAISLLRDRSNIAQYASMLLRTGRTAAAQEQYKLGESVEPMDGQPINTHWHASLTQRQFETAQEMSDWQKPDDFFDNNLIIALNEGDAVKVKQSMQALSTTKLSTITLHIPVLNAFESREEVLSILRSVYAEKEIQWPSKLHDIALLAAYFDDPGFALQVKAEEVRLHPARLMALWYPLLSNVRKLPAFRELVTEINLVAYWRAYGWADLCSPLGEDDFECH